MTNYDQLPKYPFAYGATDPRVLTGERAVAIQPLSVAMSALSKQFSASSLVTIAGTHYFALVTGTKSVRVTSIILDGKWVTGTFDIFRGGTFTGGTPITIYNNNDITPTPTECSFQIGVTMTTLGDQISPTAHLIGTLDVGNRAMIAHTDTLGDKLLIPNTVYIGRLVTDYAPVSIHFTYVEGNGYASQ